MPNYLLRVTMPYQSGLPSDVVTNDFAVQSTAGLETGVIEALIGFYNSTEVTETFPIASYIGPIVDRTTDACKIDVYVIPPNNGELGSPVATVNWTLGPTAAASSLPLEVACCLSFYAASGAGVLARRRRGRVFLGPLTGATLSSDATLPIVGIAFIDALTRAASVLKDEVVAAGAVWCVWSRGGQKPSPGAPGLFPIEAGWVDNEFDTQRRRAVKATARTTWQ